MEKELGEKDLSRMAVVRKAKRLKEDSERLESENRLLRRTTEDVLDCTFEEPSISKEHVDRLIKDSEPYHAGSPMSFDQQFRSSCN